MSSLRRLLALSCAHLPACCVNWFLAYFRYFSSSVKKPQNWILKSFAIQKVMETCHKYKFVPKQNPTLLFFFFFLIGAIFCVTTSERLRGSHHKKNLLPGIASTSFLFAIFHQTKTKTKKNQQKHHAREFICAWNCQFSFL
jgi:uncharacterized membrane protein